MLNPILLLVFLLYTFVFTHTLQTINSYICYILDIIFVCVVALLVRPSLLFSLKKKSLLSFCTVNAVAGSLCSLIIYQLGWKLPFALRDSETILFMLLLGPVLEETLYRWSLWSLIKRLNSPSFPISPLWSTSLLFSATHGVAIFVVTEAFKNFVLFQSFYTLVMALYWGRYLKETNNFAFPLTGHLTFNAAFYATSLGAFS